MDSIGWGRTGFGELPLQVHPDDTYTRVPARSWRRYPWPGVQRIDPSAGMSTLYAKIPNPYGNTAKRSARLGMDTGASQSEFPGMAVQQEQTKSLMGAIRRRLGTG